MIKLIVFILIFPVMAYAYIDPGTGASFVGSLMPLIAGVFAAVAAFLIKVFWHPIKNFFSKSKDK